MFFFFIIHVINQLQVPVKHFSFSMMLDNIFYLAPPPKVLFISIIVLNLFPWLYILHSIQTEVLFVIKDIQLHDQISIFVCIIGEMTNAVSNTLCINAKTKIWTIDKKCNPEKILRKMNCTFILYFPATMFACLRTFYDGWGLTMFSIFYMHTC